MKLLFLVTPAIRLNTVVDTFMAFSLCALCGYKLSLCLLCILKCLGWLFFFPLFKLLVKMDELVWGLNEEKQTTDYGLVNMCRVNVSFASWYFHLISRYLMFKKVPMWLLKLQFGINLPSPAAVIPAIAVKKLIIRPWVGSISCGFPCLGLSIYVVPLLETSEAMECGAHLSCGCTHLVMTRGGVLLPKCVNVFFFSFVQCHVEKAQVDNRFLNLGLFFFYVRNTWTCYSKTKTLYLQLSMVHVS